VHELLTSLQIEQFIETLYPRQNPEKLRQDNQKKQRDEPTVDPGEGFVLWAVVMMVLLCMGGIMVSFQHMRRTVFTQEPKLTSNRLAPRGTLVHDSTTHSRMPRHFGTTLAARQQRPSRTQPTTNCNSTESCGANFYSFSKPLPFF
jgi:hypothetical protein